MTQLRKATRQKTKLRLGLSAVSGGGKTVSALRMAYGITADWNKIAIIDTENGSADLYANHSLRDGFTIGEFNTLPLVAPYPPEKYIDAIKDCENAGMEVIIIDSISHEWDGVGGCLAILESHGGKYQDWAKVTPRHQKFIDAILQSSCHIITTVRRKQDYEMTKDNNGKVKVEKAGLKEVTREGFEYELTLNLEIDMNHNAKALKDRTALFDGKPEFIITEKTGELIRDWCESGVDVNTEVQDAIKKLSNCNDIPELKDLKEILPEHIKTHPDFKNAAIVRFNQLNNQVTS